jgi:hypothetical protein
MLFLFPIPFSTKNCGKLFIITDLLTIWSSTNYEKLADIFKSFIEEGSAFLKFR